MLIAGNKAVAYMGEGKVEVQSIDYPELELKDGPGVHLDNAMRLLRHMHELDLVHIAEWERRSGSPIPCWSFGRGKDSARPAPYPKERYRARCVKARRERRQQLRMLRAVAAANASVFTLAQSA